MYRMFDSKEDEVQYYQGRSEARKLQEPQATPVSSEEVGSKEVGKMDVVRLGAGSHEVGKVDMLVEDVVARGGFTLLAAEEGCGKTAWLMRLSEAVASGELFMGQLQTVKGRALIIQADEPQQDTQAKLRRMEIKGTNLEVMFVDKFDLGTVFEVISSQKYDLVILDSLTYGLTEEKARVNDDAFTDRLYKLRKWFSEYNVAGIATTHLNKPYGNQVRQTITKHEVAGLSTIRNAISDVWGLCQSPSSNDQFKMICFGKRYCPRGVEWTIQGSEEDLSFELIETSAQVLPKEKKRLIQRIIDEISSDGTPKHPRDIAVSVGSTYEVVRRNCSNLFSEGLLQRTKLEVKGRGRPEYHYRLA